jgi:hypothetical protein
LVTKALVAATTLTLVFALSRQLTLAAFLLLPIFLVPSR